MTEIHKLKGIHRIGAALVIIIALGACGADAIGPASYSGPPSLFTAAGTDAGTLEVEDTTESSDPCAPAEEEEDVSEGSTYVVAHDECETSLSDTSAIAVAPADTALF